VKSSTAALKASSDGTVEIRNFRIPITESIAV
jgi:hypothetical protein